MTSIMNNVDRLYRISNLLSFLAMLVLLLESMRIFEDSSWYDADWAFGILVVLLMLLTVQAKRLDLKRNNPNMVVPVSKYAYFASIAAFFIGYLLLEEQSNGQVVAYSCALVLEVFSTLSSMIIMSRIKKKIR
ncbi:MAG: hypothetical protein JKY54_12170 [Flavobacteriales bacterium]|nr:hypothetical protein [Flavobacteriales bacterium]